MFLVKQTKLDNSKLGSTQQQKICWHWHVARIIFSQKIYGLYARKHHIVEMRGDVTMRDDDDERTTEDRATQPMEAGGWVSQKQIFLNTPHAKARWVAPVPLIYKIIIILGQESLFYCSSSSSHCKEWGLSAWGGASKNWRVEHSVEADSCHTIFSLSSRII